MALKKLIMNIDEKLLDKVDAYASDHHINRTSAICVILSSFLEQKHSIDTLASFVQIYQAEQMKEREDV